MYTHTHARVHIIFPTVNHAALMRYLVDDDKLPHIVLFLIKLLILSHTAILYHPDVPMCISKLIHCTLLIPFFRVQIYRICCIESYITNLTKNTDLIKIDKSFRLLDIAMYINHLRVFARPIYLENTEKCPAQENRF